MNFTYAEDATPLDLDSIAGLLPNLTTQGELNEFEARNINIFACDLTSSPPET